MLVIVRALRRHSALPLLLASALLLGVAAPAAWHLCAPADEVAPSAMAHAEMTQPSGNASSCHDMPAGVPVAPEGASMACCAVSPLPLPEAPQADRPDVETLAALLAPLVALLDAPEAPADHPRPLDTAAPLGPPVPIHLALGRFLN